MKSSVEKLSDTRVKITVEVPFDELGKEIDNAYKAIAQQVSIPGFRRGKAPRQLIEARYGRGPVLEQVVNDMLPEKYGQAVEENDLKVVGQPTIDVTKLEDNKLVEFTAEVDIRPEFSLPDFSSYSVDVPALKSVDEAVAEEIEDLRTRFGTMKTVKRAAKNDDFVTIDLEAAIDGEVLEEATTEDLNHQVGSGDLIDGLDEALIGMKVDEKKEFTSKLTGGEHKDKDAQVTVTLKAVKERELPDVDDDFVQMASEHDTVDELKESLRGPAEERAKADQAAAIRDAVLTRALEETTFELPVSVVDEQVAGQLQQLLAQFGGDEKVLNALLEAQGTTRKEFDENSRTQAESAVRTQLFLDALAEELQPHVSQEELNDHILFTAQRYNMEPKQFIEQLQKTGQLGNLILDVRRGKALALAICKVSVTDDKGATVDPSAYFGDDDDTDADGVAETKETENGDEAQ